MNPSTTVRHKGTKECCSNLTVELTSTVTRLNCILSLSLLHFITTIISNKLFNMHDLWGFNISSLGKEPSLSFANHFDCGGKSSPCPFRSPKQSRVLNDVAMWTRLKTNFRRSRCGSGYSTERSVVTVVFYNNNKGRLCSSRRGVWGVVFLWAFTQLFREQSGWGQGQRQQHC